MEAVESSEKKSWRDLTPKFTVKRAIKTLGFFLYIITGCVFYRYKEGWDARTSIFFTVITISTVGYGYDYPTTDSSRVFTIFYMIIGVYMIYYYIAKELSKAFNAVISYVKSLHASQVGEDYNYHRRVMAINVLAIIICVFIGAAILNALEPEWSFVQAVYMAVQTSSTVGFGDIALKSRHTRPFLSFYIIFSSVLAACAFNNFTLMDAEKKQLERLKEKIQKQQSFDILRSLDDGSGRGVTESEFIIAVLKHIGTISEEKDIAIWREKFKEIDPDGDGKVYSDDIGLFSSRQNEAARNAEAAVNAMEKKTLVSDLKQMATTALERGRFVGNNRENSGESGSELRPMSRRVTNPMQTSNNENPTVETNKEEPV